MKKLFSGIIAAVIVSTGIFTLAGCEKEEESKTSAQNIVKCWDDNLDFNDGLFLSYPDNPEIIINISNGLAYTTFVLLEEAAGSGTIERNDRGIVTNIHCEGTGNNCGRARIILDDNTEREGIYVHEYDHDGMPIATYFDWNQIYRF